MARKFWWPGAMPDQMVLVQNFQQKIDNYGTPLGLTAADLTAAQDLCSSIIGAYNHAEGCRLSMQATTQWRDQVFTGEPVGSAVPAPPVFPAVGTPPYKVGSVKLFFSLRDRIVAAPGYTQAIGEDLGIVGVEASRPAPSSIVPELRAETSTGYWVNLSGSMQGMDALKVEYSRNGVDFQTVAFLTNTPGGFQVTPQNPTQPERGFIRAVFIKRNEEIGMFSANYPVTVS